MIAQNITPCTFLGADVAKDRRTSARGLCGTASSDVAPVCSAFACREKTSSARAAARRVDRDAHAGKEPSSSSRQCGSAPQFARCFGLPDQTDRGLGQTTGRDRSLLRGSVPQGRGSDKRRGRGTDHGHGDREHRARSIRVPLRPRVRCLAGPYPQEPLKRRQGQARAHLKARRPIHPPPALCRRRQRDPVFKGASGDGRGMDPRPAGAPPAQGRHNCTGQ